MHGSKRFTRGLQRAFPYIHVAAPETEASDGTLLRLSAVLPYSIFDKKEPTGLAGGSSYAPVRLCYQQRPNRRIANLASAFLLLAARKRATRVGKAKLRTQFILFQLFLYVIPNLLFVLAYRIHVVTPAPEFTIAVFELQIAKSFIQHQAAFTLQITP